MEKIKVRRKSKPMNKDAVAKKCGFEFFAKEEEVK